MEGGGGIDRSYQKISSGRAFAALPLFAAEAGILKISIDRYWKRLYNRIVIKRGTKTTNRRE